MPAPAVNPPIATILWGKVVPPNAGDTMWSNLMAAYNALSPTMQEIVDDMRGVHTYLNYDGVKPNEAFQERIAKGQKVSEHPLVRVHPETGEKALWVSPKFLLEIVGLTPTESKAMLAMLKTHITRPEFVYEHCWQPGDLTFWDNRCVLHIADLSRIGDPDYIRHMHRTTIKGDVPI